MSDEGKLADAFKSLSGVPYVSTYVDHLGGTASVALSVSFDEKSTWKFGIFENSKYAKLMVHFSTHTIKYLSGYKVNRFRQCRFTSIDDAVAKVQRWIDRERTTGGES